MENILTNDDHQVLSDIKTFEMFFKTHYTPLVNYANTLLKNIDEAEDKVQHVFISIWEKRHSLEIHSSLRAFLYKSVHNHSLNALKHEKIKQNHAIHVQNNHETIQAEKELEQKELQEKIRQSIQILPEKCRQIFEMSRFEDLKYKEIADRLELSVKTVENQMGKALKILRTELRDYITILMILLVR